MRKNKNNKRKIPKSLTNLVIRKNNFGQNHNLKNNYGSYASDTLNSGENSHELVNFKPA